MLSERMVRNYLNRMDRAGLTNNLGRRGRQITALGITESSTALVIEKIGFVAARADTLAFQMSYDLAQQTGKLVVNISVLPEKEIRAGLSDLELSFKARLGVGEYVGLGKAGETFAGLVVPERHVAIATVCSVTINGVFVKCGIPTTSVFGGLLEIDRGKPARFAQIIRYDGTTIDPLEIFIQGSMTSVRRASATGHGLIGAGLREVPSSARSKVMKLRDELETKGLGGIMLVGEPNQPLLDIPVAFGRMGVVLCAGLNPVAAVHERGAPTRNTAMSTLFDRQELFHYSELRQRLAE